RRAADDVRRAQLRSPRRRRSRGRELPGRRERSARVTRAHARRGVMRALALVAALAIPRIAAADWQKLEDPDCRCELALPGKPVVSTRPSPWPKLPWHRSEVRISPTEWYAVSYVVFDKAPPGNAFDAALAALKGSIVSRAKQ